MRKIGLFGGSFDPIHTGHLKLAKHALDVLKLDEVWFVVTYDQPLKDNHTESFENRVKLVKMMIKDDERLKVVEIEKDLPQPSYTYNTVVKLKKLYPDDQFVWLLGSDNIKTLDKWYKIDELRELIDFVFYGRDVDDIETVEQVIEFSDPSSSTKIRQGHLEYLDNDVLDYMFEHNLYMEAIVRANLSQKRADHVMRCVEVALEISAHYDVDQRKVYLATILHDYTKELEKSLELEIMQEHYPTMLDYHHKVYHQFTGGHMAKHLFKIDDLEIIAAIENHTSGKDEGILSKIVYLSDKLERGRKYPVEDYIQLSKENLDEAFIQVKNEAEAKRKK